MNATGPNPALVKLWAWCGPLLGLLTGIGLVVLAGFIPPPHPTDGANEIVAMYRDNLTEIRLGMVICVFAEVLLVPFGISIAVQTRKTETGAPLLTYTQIACVTIGTVLGLLWAVVWGLAAFRPDEYAPETVLMLNDLGWFLFLIDISPFTVWFIAVAIAIFQDHSESPVFPRWAAYLSLWVAGLTLPAGLILFFKTGPFAFNGLFALYLVLVAFFGWVVTMAVLVIKSAGSRRAPDLNSQAGGA